MMNSFKYLLLLINIYFLTSIQSQNISNELIKDQYDFYFEANERNIISSNGDNTSNIQEETLSTSGDEYYTSYSTLVNLNMTSDFLVTNNDSTTEIVTSENNSSTTIEVIVEQSNETSIVYNTNHYSTDINSFTSNYAMPNETEPFNNISLSQDQTTVTTTNLGESSYATIEQSSNLFTQQTIAISSSTGQLFSTSSTDLTSYFSNIPSTASASTSLSTHQTSFETIESTKPTLLKTTTTNLQLTSSILSMTSILPSEITSSLTSITSSYLDFTSSTKVTTSFSITTDITNVITTITTELVQQTTLSTFQTSSQSTSTTSTQKTTSKITINQTTTSKAIESTILKTTTIISITETNNTPDPRNLDKTLISLGVLAAILFFLFVLFALLYFKKVMKNKEINREPGDILKNEIIYKIYQKKADNEKIFNEEFNKLEALATKNKKASSVSEEKRNQTKNRYANILAYDDTRVILHDNPNGDYINANFVKGYSNPNKFIATQGPTKDTINDFWYMIWKYQVQVIVMLTNLIEKNAERCSLYWPDELNIAYNYGNGIEVTLKDQIKINDYYKRIFTLTNNQNNKEQTVVQYFYPEWPDHDAPSSDVLSILHLISNINKEHYYPYCSTQLNNNIQQQQQQQQQKQAPIVVHCSAGVGRTGSFITLDACFEQLKKESKINVFKFIKEIREMRQYLVQTPKQYIFIHEALNEYCLYGFTNIHSSALVSQYVYLKEKSNELPTKERLEIEFDKLNSANSFRSQTREACNVENRVKNRNINCVCYDENRVKLSSLNGSSYINATKISGFEKNCEFIITQDPLENTIFDFWKMISEYNCQIIVSLNRNYLNEDLYFPIELGDTKVFECDDLLFEISLDELTTNDHIIKREFIVLQTNHGSMNKLKITQFSLNIDWPESTAPSSVNTFLEFVLMVQNFNNNLEKTPLVVHAYSGGSNCSVFCALCILIDQFKADQYVDVCRTVKKLKCQRSKMVDTYEQYDFIYKCLIEFKNLYGSSLDSLTNHSIRSYESTSRSKLNPDDINIELDNIRK